MVISQTSTLSRISRRAFLGGCFSVGGMLAVSPLMAGLARDEQRRLSFRHTHTGENERITYWRNGQYLNEDLQRLNHLLRDHRTGEVAEMDTSLLDLLYALQLQVGNRGEYEIISAYRSPKTNAMLRNNSSGVAKKSLHMLGKAIDVRLCGCDLKYLRDNALALKAGGVGYYPKSGFIHLDTGRVRRW